MYYSHGLVPALKLFLPFLLTQVYLISLYSILWYFKLKSNYILYSCTPNQIFHLAIMCILTWMKLLFISLDLLHTTGGHTNRYYPVTICKGLVTQKPVHIDLGFSRNLMPSEIVDNQKTHSISCKAIVKTLHHFKH